MFIFTFVANFMSYSACFFLACSCIISMDITRSYISWRWSPSRIRCCLVDLGTLPCDPWSLPSRELIAPYMAIGWEFRGPLLALGYDIGRHHHQHTLAQVWILLCQLLHLTIVFSHFVLNFVLFMEGHPLTLAL